MVSSSSLKKELQKRAKKASVLDLSKHCFDKQLAFIKDPAKFKTGVCSRRAGKSVGCAYDLVATAMEHKGDVAYITLNRRTAKRILWRNLLQINKELQLNARVDNVDLTMTLPNDNIIYVSGAKDEADAEKWRGVALRKCYIDEAQSFRAYLKDFIEDVIEPTLIDYDGSLILIGTPGPIPTGYFYDAAQNSGWSHHAWTIHDNPHILLKSGKTADTIIEEVCQRRGVPKNHPSILREFYGQWTYDFDSLVYKFTKDINIYKEVPKDLTYIFGIDIGYQDADALAVLGYSYSANKVYLVDEKIKNKQTVTQLANMIKEAQEKYKPVKMVMDAGALGKKIQEELRSRHELPLEAADKSRKFEFIELLNDDLRTGRLQAFSNSGFEEDSYLVQWDYTNPDKVKISDTYHTDIGDAVLYGWRECKHYFYRPEPVKEPNIDIYMAELEAKEAEAMEQKLKQEDDFTDVSTWDDLGIGDDFLD